MAQSADTKRAGLYTAYLVRLWQENEQSPWRASAQSAVTGEKVYFADLESLFAFLQAQTVIEIPRQRGAADV